jgi:hypothetical protein
MHTGRPSGSVKLHSWVTAFGQQGTESKRERSVIFGDSRQVTQGFIVDSSPLARVCAALQRATIIGVVEELRAPLAKRVIWKEKPNSCTSKKAW